MKHITKVRELYEETIHWISESEDSWKNFLSCMGRLYQLDFLNTCMVYAQRPDASVLAGYDAWLEMDLPVARGSKGIAVFPSKIFGEGVTHVYDIQDVKGQGIRPWNWQVNGTNRRLLARELFPEIYEQEKKFKNSLDAFTRINVWLMIEEEDEILKSLQKLAVLTGEGQEVKENQITEFLVNSVCYAVESRCGIRDDTLDFSFICGFSENEEVLYRTGRLVSHLSGRIVLQIARTMKNIDLERRQYYGRDRRNPVQGNEWRTDTSLRGRDERGEDAGVPEPLRQDRSTGNEENGPGTIRNDAPVRETDGETYENPDRSGGIPRETGRKSSEDLDQRGQDRPLQHVGNDQPSDTGGYGSTETGYRGDHSAQDRIKREKTEKDTEKGTASAVPFSSGEIEPAQPENWQKEQILLEITEQEIPYKIYEFYRNNPEETEREAYLYELYGDVKREAHTKEGLLTVESGSSGFYILWSAGTSRKEAFWYWDEVSLEIGKRIEKGTYLPLLSVSEKALENGEEIEETIQPEQLNGLYDAFVKTHGYFCDRANKVAFRQDNDYPLLSSLEVIDEDKHVTKADIFYKRTIRPRDVIEKVENAQEALHISLSEYNRVDIPYMLSLYPGSRKELFQELKGLIYQNPVLTKEEDPNAGWETADEYLSGNVRQKLRTARIYAQNNPLFVDNVEALEKVQPKDLTAPEISVKLGTTWIENEDYEQFIYELLEIPENNQRNHCAHSGHALKIERLDADMSYHIDRGNFFGGTIRTRQTYGTRFMDAISIIEELLNSRIVTIRDRVQEGEKVRYVINRKETMLARDKAEQIKEAFRDWIFKEPERRKKYVDFYNENKSAILSDYCYDYA